MILENMEKLDVFYYDFYFDVRGKLLLWMIFQYGTELAFIRLFVYEAEDLYSVFLSVFNIIFL